MGPGGGRRPTTDLKLAQDTLARSRDLLDAGLVPAKEVREAEASASRAAIEAQRAQARLSQAGGGEGPNYVLRSPIAGVVVERAANPGQELRADGGGAPLYVITDPTRLWVWLDAPESLMPQLSRLARGTAVQVTSAAWPERHFEATLLRAEDAIDPSVRTFRMRATVANPARMLKAEMFVTARVAPPDDEREKAIEHVPDAAVLLVDGRRHVFVQAAEDTYSRVEVTVVRELPGRVAVTGLQPGQRIVVEGSLYLQQILARSGDARGTAPVETRR